MFIASQGTQGCSRSGRRWTKPKRPSRCPYTRYFGMLDALEYFILASPHHLLTTIYSHHLLTKNNVFAKWYVPKYLLCKNPIIPGLNIAGTTQPIQDISKKGKGQALPSAVLYLRNQVDGILRCSSAFLVAETGRLAIQQGRRYFRGRGAQPICDSYCQLSDLGYDA